RLGLNHHEFSAYLRGDTPLTLGFINQLCEQLHVQPFKVIPSLSRRDLSTSQTIFLQNKVTVDGVIRNVYVEGNQVIIEYEHPIN
ncbi:XRE family transcriptional regulator, partial [Vibrio vulnificus]|nr:XRE family transcriptional regulator [Vibrio vulnificus]